MQPARALHLLQLPLEPRHPVLDQATVGFDLRFAGTAHEAEAAALALEVGPGADETALLVAEMGEIDLKPPFARAGATPENLENQAGAVDHLGVERLLQIALLHRRERGVDDEEADLLGLRQRGELLDLALAHQRRGARRIGRHDHRAADIEIDGPREADRLVEPRLIGPGRREIDARATPARAVGTDHDRARVGRDRAFDIRLPAQIE